MPPIRYLERLGRAAPGSTGVNTIPVTADDFGTRMIAEPFDERIRPRIFQQIDDAMRIGIHQNPDIAPTQTKGKLVYPQNRWRVDVSPNTQRRPLVDTSKAATEGAVSI